MKHSKNKGKPLIRNSTAEFLIFTGQAGEQSIEARYEDETIWQRTNCWPPYLPTPPNISVTGGCSDRY